jgi:hypothetical protein
MFYISQSSIQFLVIKFWRQLLFFITEIKQQGKSQISNLILILNPRIKGLRYANF